MLRTRPPEPQPIQLRQSRVYVLPTRAGVAMVATVLVMLLASINYNLSLGYALCFVLTGVWVVHIFESWRCLANLEITIHPVGESFAAGTAAFEATLTNHGKRARTGIVMREEARKLLRADIPGGGITRATFNISAPHRGRLFVGQLTVECQEPLGWIRAWSYIEPDAAQIVFPKPAGNSDLPVSGNHGIASYAAQNSGHDDFAGLRNTLQTDPLRHIAWKIHARGRPLQSKVFSATTSPELVLNWFDLPAATPLESKLSQLTLWLLIARQHGLRITLKLPGDTVAAGQDANHYHRCLMQLALFSSVQTK